MVSFPLPFVLEQKLQGGGVRSSYFHRSYALPLCFNQQHHCTECNSIYYVHNCHDLNVLVYKTFLFKASFDTRHGVLCDCYLV